MPVRKFVETLTNPSPAKVQEAVESLTRNHGNAINTSQASPLASPTLLEGVSLTTTAANVSHSLGRAWKGAVAVKGVPSGAQVVFEDSQNNEVWASVSVSTGTATVSILFF